MNMFKKNVLAGIGLIIGLFMLTNAPVKAVPHQESRVTEDGKVYISDKVFCFIRYAAKGASIKERADVVRERLRDVLSLSNLKASDIAVTGNKKEATVKVRGKLLITVDERDAKMEKLPGALAYGKKLAKNLRESFTFLPKARE